MKRLSICLLMGISLISASVLMVFADVEADYNLVCIGNDGDSTSVNIDSETAETVSYLSDEGLILDWGEWNGSRIPLYITANSDTDIGNSAITVFDDDNTDDFDIIHVLVYDNFRTDIYSAKAGKGKATIKWYKGYTDYYQMQYKKAGGTWKNVFFGNRTKWTVYGLKKGKKYSFRVRPVTPSYEWGNQYGPWSDSVTIKIK